MKLIWQRFVSLHPTTWCARAVVAGGALLLLCSTARAGLTYLDADFGTNTGPAAASAGTTTAPDGLWGQRPFGSSATIFEASGTGSGAEDAAEIYTTISGLSPGLYKVYVHFWDGSGPDPDWNVRAGFTSGSLTLYANGVGTDATDLGATGAGLASDLTYSTAPTVFVEADRTMYAGLVGTAAANGSGEITVYVDDLPSTIGANNRSWYDGVSYAAVPEPASALLLALALPALFIRRRRD